MLTRSKRSLPSIIDSGEYGFLFHIAQLIAFAYSFKFSPRPGTPGATLENQIPDSIKDSRLALLQEILLDHQSEFNKSSIGKTVPVLFDRKGRVDGQLLGRTKFMQPVHANLDDNYMGQVSQVIIDTATSNSLGGSVTK